MRLTSLLLGLQLTIAASVAAGAQTGPFSPAIQVNDSIITNYELEQRTRFLEVLSFPGDIRAEAENGLIEDRLRLQAAEKAGVALNQDQISAGMAEFASRANMPADQFVQALGEAGINEETFRDFVTAGVVWRDVIRARYSDKVDVSDAEIDRAISADSGRGAGQRILMSELYIRARPGEVLRSRTLALKIKEAVTSEAKFSEMAKLYSAGISRKDGGKVDWIPVSNLPPQVAGAIATLGRGQVSEPVVLNGAVGLFMVRGLEGGSDKVPPGSVVVDYARLVFPVGPDAATNAARAAADASRCDDLYTVAAGRDGGLLHRTQAKRGQIPAELGRVLDGLDANEKTVLNRGGSVELVMLCSRNASIANGYFPRPETPAAPVFAQPGGATAPIPLTRNDVSPAIIDGLGLGYGPSRDTVRSELVNGKMEILSDVDLAALKANAIIVRP